MKKVLLVSTTLIILNGCSLIGMNPAANNPPENTSSKYEDYVKYNEGSADPDPVAPYSTDEDCSENGCEASRVNESYHFELRDSEEDGMMKRIDPPPMHLEAGVSQ